MTRFRVPAASLLTLLLAAANLLSQTVRPAVDVELEVQQLPLGTSVPCTSLQPIAANYLLSWSGLCQQTRAYQAEEKCNACPESLAAKHALVVSQLVNALQCDSNKCEGEKRTVRVTCEIKCGSSLTQALEACCKPLIKWVCTPSSSPCAACPVTQAACCADLNRTAPTTAAAKASCACGEKCACCKKTCGCGTDCACKESDKKAQRRAARRAFAMPPMVLPHPIGGDGPLPVRPPVLMPMAPNGPMPSAPHIGFSGPQAFFDNLIFNNPHLLPMMPPPVCPPYAVCPAPTPREQQLCAQDLAILQAARFVDSNRTRTISRVRFETDELEVECDRLTRLRCGRIVCEGDVRMNVCRQHHPSRIIADRIVVCPDGSFEVGGSDN